MCSKHFEKISILCNLFLIYGASFLIKLLIASCPLIWISNYVFFFAWIHDLELELAMVEITSDYVTRVIQSVLINVWSVAWWLSHVITRWRLTLKSPIFRYSLHNYILNLWSWVIIKNRSWLFGEEVFLVS